MTVSGQPVSIGALAAQDHAGVAVLMAQMQAHYRVPCPDRADLLTGLAALPPGVEVLVARAGAAVVGFAFAANVFPGPGLKSGFFLKELYVADAARGAGIGRALMRALAGLALMRGHSRVDWTADAADPQLLRFYESLGAVAQTEKVFFRLTGEALARLGDADSEGAG